MVLVTGGTGLTGSHLLFELTKNGESVRAIRREGSSTDFVKKVFSYYTQNYEDHFRLIEWAPADLLDYSSLLDAVKGIDTVYHTGAMVSFNPRRSGDIIGTNVDGTANLVEACVERGVKSICHVSSIAALGEPNDYGIIDEECIWTKTKGMRAYNKSKFLSEMEVWRAAEHGLRVIIVNPSVIIGPGRWDSGSGQILKRVSKGMPFYTEGVSGYVDVRDVARAMVLLTNNGEIVNERFILNSENLSYKEIFTMMAGAIGAKPPKIKVKKSIVGLIWPFVKVFSLLTGYPVSKSSLQSVFVKTNYSSEKIRNRIGFEFIPVQESVNFAGKIFKNRQ